MENYLVAENLKKVYSEGNKEVVAISEINLSLKQGEILVVFGPSGSGKSTLLHLLGGLDRPTEGKVLLDGTDLSLLSDEKLARVRNEKFGFIFQFYHLLSEFTILENVLLPLFIGKKENIKISRERAKDLLAKFGLEDRVHFYPSSLSGGEQQRVAIARALINNPEVIFADEPTGNLDKEAGDFFWECLLELNRENHQTFLLVTHNEVMAKAASRVLTLREGRIV
ncbi:MAG: lipoprotein-releasing system ATP-binding protein LolD [bacterium (Candidatus Ratteibacteria) CG_4_10_14_3_um_filter_41_18]|uniref:Lipoprotein-releasing system ATP-binding protein LolD n=4 Tax=Candidatus Ratteibacteria TaxID=2979319 RepID=A0A2M7E8Y1_9BACT|nr:MAG: ABC transporter ATP-binding protein [Candidatus Omnitrophica bacterium CG1_02_41_171]PIV64202.1 MAG: lipoprotein-releasing system ATP-binding protein LolD [bacterium (Candidatus Ratteibacteria) CG01_land_8_20_14_3_00_40_19]PIW33651.1 MAG: lipoprotein-releasing system ATP-binding protein LolD [bacterium (Candidatus Ratteibacteria) CG15_BIG_FIL_POST_REV_8_21_14_020_41_12]PIW74102.1 MAG: lipoprotein-releasing system ATP-binding protein LolD [bacterium (Candidatus Ratteibacteria) CG_4_8_14_3